MRSGLGIAVESWRPCRSPHSRLLPSSAPLSPLCRPGLCQTTLRHSSADASLPTSSFAEPPQPETPTSEEDLLNELEKREGFRRKRAQHKVNMRRAKSTYQFIAWAASLFMLGLAVFATSFKFILTKPKGSPFPWLEFIGTMALVVGGTACMEMYARWAHKVWWHDLPGGWALHKSHHAPRTGPFEANDIYAVANAIPAFILCYVGFFSSGFIGSLLFGFGLGITLFGMAYMFVHDGLVHKRFPVGPLASLPFMKRVAAAHMLHHAHKYDGKPFGMFLGPQEIRDIPGATEEMEKLASIL